MLKTILTNDSIIKIGFQIRQALLAIREAYTLPHLIQATRSGSNSPFIDLGHHAKLTGALEDPNTSLHMLVGVILKKSFTPPSLEWASTLSTDAISALYIEADCFWQLWLALSSRESIGLKLVPKQLKAGQPITLVQSCKPVARGLIITDHSGHLDVPTETGGEIRHINISPTHTLIDITKVLVPHAIHNLHRQTIKWIFSHGRKAVAATSQLRSRAATPAVAAASLTYGFSVPAPSSSTLSEDHSNFTLSYHALTEAAEAQFNIWEPSEADLYVNEESDFSEFKDMEVHTFFHTSSLPSLKLTEHRI